MADIRAFRGFRYDLGRAGPLSDLVAPPYDVIDPALQQTLYDRSPYNAIRLELTSDEPGDSPSRNRYTRAAQALSGWQTDDVLRQDTAAHPVRLSSRSSRSRAGRTRRRGFMARVRLEPFGTGRIYPHEQTMSGPKADRLKLFRATGHEPEPDLRPLPGRGQRGVRPDRAARPPAPCRWRRRTTSASSAGCGR